MEHLIETELPPELVEMAAAGRSQSEIELYIRQERLLKRLWEHATVIAAYEWALQHHHTDIEAEVTVAVAAAALRAAGREPMRLHATTEKQRGPVRPPEPSSEVEGHGWGWHEIEVPKAAQAKIQAMGEADIERVTRVALRDLEKAVVEWHERTGWLMPTEIHAFIRRTAAAVLPIAVRWREQARIGDPAWRSRQRATEIALASAEAMPRASSVQRQAALTLILGPIQRQRFHRHPSWFLSHLHGDWAHYTADEWVAHGGAWLMSFGKLRGTPWSQAERRTMLTRLAQSAVAPVPVVEQRDRGLAIVM